MDISLLSKIIKELLSENDEVILPKMGVFVTEDIPSSFTDKGYTINPPYKRLGFRPKHNISGSKIAEFYAESNNIDIETASHIINSFADELLQIMETKRIIVFPELGRLRATKENNLFFVADENQDFFPEYFGLEPVSLKTHEETEEEVSEVISDLKSIITGDNNEDATISELSAGEESHPENRKSHDEVTGSGVQNKKSIKLVIIIIMVSAIIMLIFIIFLSQKNPEFIDKFLYTPEQLDILYKRV